MKNKRTRTSLYSEKGSRKVEYYAILKLLDEGCNPHEIHKKLDINLYSVRNIRDKWLKMKKEDESNATNNN